MTASKHQYFGLFKDNQYNAWGGKATIGGKEYWVNLYPAKPPKEPKPGVKLPEFQIRFKPVVAQPEVDWSDVNNIPF